jgi:integrase
MNGQKSASKPPRGIYERVPGSGVWSIQYTDAHGRRRREKAGLYSTAEKLLDKRHTQTLQGKKLPETLRAKPVTFGELLDDALEYSKSENGVRTTMELRLKYDIVRPVFGTRSAEDIEKQEIRRWLVAKAAEENWKRATMMRWHAAISLAYSQGMANNRIQKNPVARMFKKRKMGEDNGRTRFLSEAEERAICAKLQEKHPECVPAFLISLHSGMRAGEQFSLQWNQIQWDQRKLHLYKTKNGTARDIDLNAVALDALTTLKAWAGNSPLVHVNEKGESLTRYRDWFNAAVKSAGLADYTWHCNRHTFASRLVMAGESLRTVGELLGHRSPAMTWRYSHLAPSHRQNAVARLVPVAKPEEAKPGDTQNENATRSATGGLFIVKPEATKLATA